MKKYFLSFSQSITICSSSFSIICLLSLRQIDRGGDLFSQINSSILSGLAIGLFMALLRNKRAAKKRIRRDLHSILTVQLIVFILLQFSLVNIDRSRSFYVLSWANQNKVFDSKNGIGLVGVQSPEKLNSLAIQIRVDEQIEKKLLKNDSDRIKPTMAGKILILIADTLAKLFNLENWESNKN